MSDFRQELLAVFEAEHKEHLSVLRRILDDAERGHRPDLREASRRAHTLKGAGRAVDLPAVERLAHALEALFEAVQAGRQALDRAAVSAVQGGLDALESHVAAMAAGRDAPAPEGALAALEALAGAAPLPAAAAAAPAGLGPPESAHPAASAGIEYIRVTAEQADRLSGAVQAMVAELQRREGLADALRGADAEFRALLRDWDEWRRRDDAGAARTGDARLEALDQGLKALARRIGALSLTRRGESWSLDQAARRLRAEAGRISLVSAEEVLGPLGRMAREIAREEGRDLAVRMEGLGIRADRRVLQALKDPILHMLRNAIGHGAEPEATRRAKGKPPHGEVGLILSSAGGRLVATVFDDGAGPDLDRIEAVAVGRGLLPPRGPEEPPRAPDQLLSLVFKPGFSTAPAVDRLSGRGMGLSVAAEVARALRGGIQLRVRRPWGAEVELSIPLSGALQAALLVEWAGRRVALPAHGVERLLRLRRDALERVEGRPVARIAIGGRDVVVPVIPLAALLGSHAAELPVEADHLHAVLLRRGPRRCAVAVEALRDVRTLLVGDADMPGADPELVAGAALLEDDTPILVLSPDGLVARWVREESRLAAGGLGLAEEQAPTRRMQPTILVVDDSITTRTLEKSILEAQGYRVVLSVDGLDALTLLRSGEAVVDLVVADVEMPRMDGFALLQAMKADPHLTRIPVVLMTSRDDPADIRRGLELGAQAYVTKQKFEQGELLATIGQLL
ncbi:MAG TPA: response regulator [Falsiroseomonas sp.]|jgi:two-component system chemotaxis sensor kinase CheA|nr:response regulator [Falsiroseomonas sp.]